MDHSLIDRFNQAWYGRRGSVVGMAEQGGFGDEGERAAYERIASEVRDRPILDLGVGSGRTVPLMRALSSHYVGVDYVPAMLDEARSRHPGVDLRLGDARDLALLPADHFALVMFSCQGIDSVGHADRQRVLREAWRVLEPNGVFWFSTLNQEGPAARYRPWRPLPSPRQPGAAGLVRHWARRARAWLRVPRHLRSYLRGSALAVWGEGWSVAPFFAGEWALVAHFTTLACLLGELVEAGFAPDPAVFDDAQGRHLAPGDALDGVFCFNVLARKPAAC